MEKKTTENIDEKNEQTGEKAVEIVDDNSEGMGIKQKDYHCDSCDLKFPSKTLLESHLASSHAKVDKVACDLCGLQCFPSNLNLHVAKFHREKVKVAMNEDKDPKKELKI